MKRNASLSALLPLIVMSGNAYAQAVTTGAPGVVYQNPAVYPTATPVYATPAQTYTTTSTGQTVATPTYTTTTPTYISSPSPYVVNSTYPSTINYSASLPGQPIGAFSQGTLPGQAYFNPNNPTQSFIPPQYNPNVGAPGNPGGQQPSILQQIYPQPANPNISTAQAAPPPAAPPLQITQIPYEYVAPPESYTPGLATIKDHKWVVSDFLYKLSYDINVKVEIIKPAGKYVPLSETLLEKRITDVFQDADVPINTEPEDEACRPPLPMFYVLIMAYPCDKRCIGFVSAQLYEEARPQRIDIDLNGVWQTITWERQALVASACDEFEMEIGETLEQIAEAFSDKFSYYHPVEEQPCFPPVKTARETETYERYYNPDYRCGICK